MDQNDKAPEGAKTDPVESPTQSDKSAEDWQRLVDNARSEAKGYRLKMRDRADRIADLETQVQSNEDAKLESEGKYKEQNVTLKEQLESERTGRKKEKAGFIWSNLTSQVRDEATKMGCVDSADLVALLSANKELDQLDYDQETFQARKESILEILERARKAKPYLFGKGAPNVHTGIPGYKTQPGKNLNEMTVAELEKEFLKQG